MLRPAHPTGQHCCNASLLLTPARTAATARAATAPAVQAQRLCLHQLPMLTACVSRVTLATCVGSAAQGEVLAALLLPIGCVPRVVLPHTLAGHGFGKKQRQQRIQLLDVCLKCTHLRPPPVCRRCCAGMAPAQRSAACPACLTAQQWHCTPLQQLPCCSLCASSHTSPSSTTRTAQQQQQQRLMHRQRCCHLHPCSQPPELACICHIHLASSSSSSSSSLRQQALLRIPCSCPLSPSLLQVSTCHFHQLAPVQCQSPRILWVQALLQASTQALAPNTALHTSPLSIFTA
jgi:hypothetical protein